MVREKSLQGLKSEEKVRQCPECGSTAVRYGTRKLKHRISQRYCCTKCGKIVSDKKTQTQKL